MSREVLFKEKVCFSTEGSFFYWRKCHIDNRSLVSSLCMGGSEE